MSEDCRFSRTRMIIGDSGLQKLATARIAVFGIGGVGSYTVEALARSGVGAIDIIDNDTVCETNINRQLFALSSTVGRYKVDVAEERIMDINPRCTVHKFKCFFLPENSESFDFSLYDYVVDAIDTLAGKIELVKKAQHANVPIISCMGAGNKLEASAFKVADVYKTAVCPLARKMRTLCKANGIKKLKVVYSEETPIIDCKMKSPKDIILNTSSLNEENASELGINSSEQNSTEQNGFLPKKRFPGSISFVPGAAGLIVAGEVVKDLLALK